MHEHELEYVGFWPRVLASIIDTIIIAIITYPVLYYIYGKKYFNYEHGFVAGPMDFLISWVCPAILVLGLWEFCQATPGKMMIHAKIVDAVTGDPPSTGQYIGRYFAYFLSIIPLFLGIIWVGIDLKKQGWHDKLAGTVVVRPKYRGPEPVRFK